MPPGHTPLHWANIAVHAGTGSLALLFGLVAICAPKRGPNHRRFGYAFLYAYAVVVVTAAIGILAFEFRSFLAVVTVVSFYDAFAGYRALQLRGARPQPLDIVAAMAGLCTPWFFIAMMRRLHQPWSPVLTWSVLGGLVVTSSYDLLRTIIPITYLRRTWIQEHLLKMIGAYIAISSAFAGTVFPHQMPLAAILPSAVGETVALVFLVIGPRAWTSGRDRKLAVQQTVSARQPIVS